MDTSSGASAAYEYVILELVIKDPQLEGLIAAQDEEEKLWVGA